MSSLSFFLVETLLLTLTILSARFSFFIFYFWFTRVRLGTFATSMVANSSDKHHDRFHIVKKPVQAKCKIFCFYTKREHGPNNVYIFWANGDLVTHELRALFSVMSDFNIFHQLHLCGCIYEKSSVSFDPVSFTPNFHCFIHTFCHTFIIHIIPLLSLSSNALVYYFCTSQA